MMPTFTMRQLLESGVHFGHQTRRWNPKMGPYLYGSRSGIHIIDLRETVPLLHQALSAIRDVTAKGGRVLFVGTKRQASQKIKESASLSGQYYVNHRWLGGMLTNWKTISKSIKRLQEIQDQLDEEEQGFTKKELLSLERTRDKLELSLGGIKELGGTPDILFVIDTNQEDIAIKEANKLGIPVVAIVDSNSNPDGIDYPIPGNDDAQRAIDLYCTLVSAAILDGLQAHVKTTGVDIGAAEEVSVVIEEEILLEPEAKEKTEGKAETKVKVETKPKPKVKVELKAKPEEKAAEKSEEAKSAPKSKPTKEETLKVEPKPKPKPKPKSQSKAEAKPKVKSETATKAKTATAKKAASKTTKKPV